MYGGTLRRVEVDSAESLNSAVLSYAAQGFVVVDRTSTQVILNKRKQFQIIWAVIGFFACILPFLVYLLVYAITPDTEAVQIAVRGT